MSTASTGASQEQSLRKANNASVKDQSSPDDWAIIDQAPTAIAYRVAPTTVWFTCPNCLGIHAANVPQVGLGQRTRSLNCEPLLRTNDHAAVNLDVWPEPPPPEWQELFRRGTGYRDLEVAMRLLCGSGARTSAARLARVSRSADEDHAWGPSQADVKFVLGVLKAVGALSERAAWRGEAGGLSGRAMWRGAASDEWRTNEGQRRLERLRSLVRAAWRDLGAPGLRGTGKWL